MDEMLEKFGVKRWRGFDSREVFPTRATRRVGEMIQEAVRRQAWVAIRGEAGSGKTTAVGAALDGSDATVIRPEALETGRVCIGHILEAVLRELSSEGPRRSIEARCHQARRVLGEAARKKRIVLVLEDAHYLHRQTLTALKRLREMEWAGKTRLLGVVLVGLPELSATLRALPEAGLRCRTVAIDGMTKQEAARYVEWLGLAPAFAPGALDALVASAQRPLEIQASILDAAERAYYAGAKKIGIEHVVGDSVRRRVITEGISEVARAARVSKATVHKFAHGGEVGQVSEERIRAALRRAQDSPAGKEAVA